MISWFIPWVSMRNQELSNMPKGKWQRAIAKKSEAK